MGVSCGLFERKLLSLQPNHVDEEDKGVTKRDTLGHVGNCPKETQGCILVGRNTLPGCVLGSREKLDALMKRLATRTEGEAVHITVE